MLKPKDFLFAKAGWYFSLLMALTCENIFEKSSFVIRSEWRLLCFLFFDIFKHSKHCAFLCIWPSVNPGWGWA